MSLSISEIAKKKGISYSGAFRKMRNQKPVTAGYKRLYSEDSVSAAFKNEEMEIIAAVAVRNIDCVDYPECLTAAAILDLKSMDCGTCEKYEKEDAASRFLEFLQTEGSISRSYKNPKILR